MRHILAVSAFLILLSGCGRGDLTSPSAPIAPAAVAENGAPSESLLPQRFPANRIYHVTFSASPRVRSVDIFEITFPKLVSLHVPHLAKTNCPADQLFPSCQLAIAQILRQCPRPGGPFHCTIHPDSGLAPTPTR